MASKTVYLDSERGAEVEEHLETLEKLLDRVKVLYEQYFLGIQKQPPAHMHTECERRVRDLNQLNIRNTAHRYRFAMLSSRFSSYSSYWKRTLRQIEQGTYYRSLSKVGRKAVTRGQDIPEEILAAMPKRMRDQVMRDRANALAQAKRRGADVPAEDAPDLGSDDARDEQWGVATVYSPPPTRDRDGAHRLSFDDDADLEGLLAGLGGDDDVDSFARDAPATVMSPSPFAVDRSRAGSSSTGSPRATAPPLPGMVPRAATTPPPMPKAPPRATTVPPPMPARAPVAAPTPTPTPRPVARVATPRPAGPPPGMSDADVKTVYAQYAKAREMLGEQNDARTYERLLKTMHDQAPKIMAQFKAQGVEFGVVVRDNQVILKAKPKTKP